MGLGAIRSVDYIVLLCTDVQRAKRFYADVMGFPVEVDGASWVSFRVGAAVLALRRRGPGPAGDDGPSVPGSAAVQLAFRVPPSALEECAAELAGHGSLFKGPVDLPALRHRALFFLDPEGNLVEIYAEY